MWSWPTKLFTTSNIQGRRKVSLESSLISERPMIEWNGIFFMVVLKAFGFSNSFINLIHQSLSTAEFTLLLNGGLGPSLFPFKGLRQGDPLSPYLFILGNEVLIRLINREVSQKNLTRVKVSNTAPPPPPLPISKLFYANDIILFCKAKSYKLAILSNCLEKFCS